MSRLATEMFLGRAERMLEKDDPAGAFLLINKALGTDPDEANATRYRLRLGSRHGKCRGSKNSCASRNSATQSWHPAADLFPPTVRAASGSGTSIPESSHKSGISSQAGRYPGPPFIPTPENTCLSQPPMHRMRLRERLEPGGTRAKSPCGMSRPVNLKASCARWPTERREKPGSAQMAATGYLWSAIRAMAMEAEWRSGISRQELWRQVHC